uniref:C2H2-type domain-containing protein n=1 Tax=Glossina palpalis gambiensis TaxID=67801 RepID=A0A1B0BY13_9MUSC
MIKAHLVYGQYNYGDDFMTTTDYGDAVTMLQPFPVFSYNGMPGVEKESQIEYQQQRDCRRAADPIYKSSNRFYDNKAFLLPHLGPFKCSHCPKIIYHINTFRIHTAKHDGRKVEKLTVHYWSSHSAARGNY